MQIELSEKQIEAIKTALIRQRKQNEMTADRLTVELTRSGAARNPGVVQRRQRLESEAVRMSEALEQIRREEE